MLENRSILFKSAMTYGLSFGLFWCFKYIFFMLGVSSNFFSFIYMTLTFFVPFIGLYYTWRYKMDVGGQLGFMHGWQFGVLLYFFAAMVVALLHYMFYRYMAPPGFLANSLQQTIDMLKSAEADSKMIEAIEGATISPIQMAIQGIFNNVFYGIIFSIPVAYIVKRLRTPVLPDNEDTTDDN
ncbi:DUF4199 domain-containing protein [Parabacteroides sp. OttesenSCG-928-B22]|nr:DUF4199 domain-containing protein [Parabacteroides sp. OttesenSCG-928-B22]